MNRVFQFLGMGTFIFGIGYGILYLKSNNDIFNEVLRVLGLVALVALVGYVLARMIWGKHWVVKGGANTVIGGDLIAAIQQFTQELPAPSKEATASLVGNIIYRFTRIGVFAVLIALIPLALLWQQNQLLSRQNEKIDKQNDLFSFQNDKVTQQTDLLLEQTGLLKTQIDLFGAQNANVDIQTGLLGTQNEQLVAQNRLFRFQNQKVSEQTDLFKKQNEKLDVQITLEESSRRGNLIVMMSNIMDKVDEELTNDWNKDSIRNLSPQLIGRIAALSHAFKPYRFLQDNKLILLPLSPERGQLLMALVNSDLDSITYSNIYEEATFEQANLANANLRSVDLSGVHLSDSNLRFADLSDANLSYADLSGTDLMGVELKNADLRSIYLNYASLRDANLRSANLSYANLFNADLNSVDLRDADLSNIDLRGINLRDADLSGIDLRGVELISSNLSYADLSNANLSNSNLSYADLSNANLIGTYLWNASLIGVNLKNTRVGKKNWIEQLQVFGITEIKEKWMVNTTIENSIFGDSYDIVHQIQKIKEKLPVSKTKSNE